MPPPSDSDSAMPGAPEADAPPRRRNSFGLLRLVLASLVIVQHSLALTGNEDGTLLGWWRPATVGDIAVTGFFGLSGYLLLPSTVRHTPRRFLRLRFHRLFPGFWAVLLFVAFAVAPLVALRTDSWAGYDVIGTESATSYVVLNSFLVIFQHGIGGLLAANPWADAFDGSLWSLAPEFACYLVLLGSSIAARRLHRPLGLVMGLLAVGAATAHLLAEPVLGDGLGESLGLLASLASAFFFGSVLACTGWLSRPHALRAGGLAAATAVAVTLGLWQPLGPPLLAASVVALGLSMNTGWTTRVDKRADLSYGVYLYHFPVIQVIMTAHVAGLSAATALGVLAPVTLMLTLPLAAGSWFLVEAPALRRGRRKRRGSAAASAEHQASHPADKRAADSSVNAPTAGSPPRP